MLALQREILLRGAWPILGVELPGADEQLYEHAQDAQLDEAPSALVALYDGIDSYLWVEAPANTRNLSDVDPARIARWARARQPIKDATLAKRWSVTLWPTPAGAQEAGMSELRFADVVRRACFLDREEPIAAWRELRAFQERLIGERLAQARVVRIEAEDTDLTVGVAGRRWVNSDGKRNMPSGEVFTSPLEHTAEGTIRLQVPSSARGVAVEDIRLTFAGGEVVAAEAARGQDYLEATLDSDDGARRLGELAIGTNRGIDRPVGAILFDEKMHGTIHIALGSSYPEAGGENASAVHWDIVCDLREGGRLWVDGEVLQENGDFFW
jgi:aminopeptidase